MKSMFADVLNIMLPVHLWNMVDLMSLLVAPTVFLLVSPLSTTPAITVELIVILGLLHIIRLFALLAFLTLAAITVRLALAPAFALSQPLMAPTSIAIGPGITE